MSNKVTSLQKIFKQSGILFPTTPESVELFKKVNCFDLEENPKDWDSPLDILRRGSQKLSNLNINKIDISNVDVQNLAMVAREGKTIPSNVREKMLDDRKNAKKK